MNAVMVAVLAGFVVAGFGGTLFVVGVYGASAIFVTLVAGVVLLGGRRRPRLRGFVEPANAAKSAAVLFAIGAAMIWLGLAFGMWISVSAAFPLVIAGSLEIYAHHRR